MLAFKAKDKKQNKADLKIKGVKLLCMDKDYHFYEDGCLLVSNGKIIGAGHNNDFTHIEAYRVIDGYNKLCMPGLVNTHTHAGMSIYRGVADDLPLMTWLNEHIWPLEAKFGTKESVNVGTRLSLIEMLRSGTTTFCDMYFFAEEVGAIAKEYGMRAIIGEGIIDFPTPSMKSPGDALDHMAYLVEKWGNEDLISVAFSPHAPYSCDKGVLKEAKSRANALNCLFHIHLSESQNEVEQCREKFGLTPTAYLDSLGIIDRNSIAAHCVHLTEEDRQIIVEKGMGVSHNPQSNMKISSGIAPIFDLIQKGARVGIGTDGCASNNNLNMFEEMDFASKLQKVDTMNPTALDAKTTVSIGTLWGADILGLSNVCGSLEVGKDADFILIDLDQPQLTPFYNPYSHIIYAMNGSEVDSVFIKGNSIMEKRIFTSIDMESVMNEAKSFEKDIRLFKKG